MKQRNPALDIIRIFALLCVIGVHFFLLSDFYPIPVTGTAMAGMIIVRCFCMICVPLFLMLSGYLLKEKTLSRKYYSRIVYILGIYVLACISCGLYKCLYMDESVKDMVIGVFSYRTAAYGWYVEMYIGLFLLIPFLNMIYKGLETRKKRKLLLLTFLFLTAMPSLLNTWELGSLSYFLHPSRSLEFDPLIPNCWRGLYPVTFYFMGAYLKDHPLKLKTGKHLLLIGLSAIVFGMFCYYRSYGRTFIGAEWAEHRSIFCTVLSFFVFSFLAERPWKSIGPKTAKILSKLSSWTLGAYLCSEIFDRIVYGIRMEQGYPMLKRMALFPLTVGTVFLCSMTLSAILNGIYNILAHLFRKKEKTT